MTGATLLCPLSDFPYMLPGCFPVALVLVVAALVPLAAILYRVHYYLRHQRVSFPEAIRLRGRVGGVPPRDQVLGRDDRAPARRFLLERSSGPALPVSAEGAILAGGRRTLRAGQAVTVLGMAGSVPRAEALFRQPAAEVGVQALQIAPDRLRLARCLWVAALLGWAGFAAWLVPFHGEARRRYESQVGWMEHTEHQDGPPDAMQLIALDPDLRDRAEEEEQREIGERLRQREEEAAPRVVVGRPEVRGALDREIVRRVVRRHLNEVKYCYQKELQAFPHLEGKLVVQFTVVRTGQVVASALQASSLGNESVESCVTQAVRRWMFPRPQGGGIAIISYPFVLQHPIKGGVQG